MGRTNCTERNLHGGKGTNSPCVTPSCSHCTRAPTPPDPIGAVHQPGDDDVPCVMPAPLPRYEVPGPRRTWARSGVQASSVEQRAVSNKAGQQGSRLPENCTPCRVQTTAALSWTAVDKRGQAPTRCEAMSTVFHRFYLRLPCSATPCPSSSPSLPIVLIPICRCLLCFARHAGEVIQHTQHGHNHPLVLGLRRCARGLLGTSACRLPCTCPEPDSALGGVLVLWATSSARNSTSRGPE